MPAPAGQPRLAVVGHVEWVTFARVEHIPAAGEIVHAREPFAEPAGGGAVAAVQLARLAGSCTLLTALGDDELAERAATRLGELGVGMYAVAREAPTRTGVTLVDDAGERAITTFGPRLQPAGADAQLPWEELADMDAVYFTAGDLTTLRAARAARVLVASPRALHALGHGVPLDALVLSAGDETERTEAAREDAHGEAELLVLTDGARGGTYRRRDGSSGASGGSSGSTGISSGSWTAAPPPGPALDSYGCGDSFAAGLTYGLGAGMAIEDALDLAARCGAYCLTGRGPYERQLTRTELG